MFNDKSMHPKFEYKTLTNVFTWIDEIVLNESNEIIHYNS